MARGHAGSMRRALSFQTILPLTLNRMQLVMRFRPVSAAVRCLLAAFLCVGLLAYEAKAQQTLAEKAGLPSRPHLSFYGEAGLIDMPTADSLAEGDFATTVSYFGVTTRVTLSFQVTNRLNGIFRYSGLRGLAPDPNRDVRYDRSFDVSYRLLDENDWRPAVKIGLRDFGGTGLFSSEYVVATKSFGPRKAVKVTGGLGWGRLATSGGFDNPLEALFGVGTRVRQSGVRPIEEAGRIEIGDLFRGDTAFFGGISWQVNDRLLLIGEYSSDDYTFETNGDVLDIKSQFNFGASYKVSDTVDVGLYYLYGNELGFRVNYVLNPKVPPAASGIEPGPQPVQPRPNRRSAPQVWTTAWVESEATQAAVQTAVIAALGPEGLLVESLDLSASEAHVTLRNRRFDQSAQAIGRAARALTRSLPASVETFHIGLVEQGMPTTRVTLQRSDLEELEFAPDNAWQSYVRADIADAGTEPNARRSLTSPRFSFAVTGYVDRSLFDPDQPLSFDLGVRLTTNYEPRPGWVLNTSVRQPLYSNRDNINRVSNSVIQTVRSEQDDFNRGDQAKLDRLTLAHYFRPAENLYGRITAGYLELAYAGVSSEVLWKPSTSRLALGVELNAVHQREPREPLALGEGQFDYETITGHASAYYALDNGFHAQLDVGRYLAEDWGGTFTLTREFRNGWRVGAFFTLTDVSFDDFGEGAFDKGIFVTLPTSWSIGQPSRQDQTTVIRPVLRDGGARVEVSDRLYDLVKRDSDPYLSDSWGRFWR